MADERQSGGDERQLLREPRPRHQFILRHRGADLDGVAAVADRIELGDLRNIDKHRRIDQPQIKHGDERLAAGEDARVVAVFGEQRCRLLDCIGPRIVERTWFHCLRPFSACGRNMA